MVAALSAAVVFVTALGVGLVVWQWRRAESQAAAEAIARRRAEDEGRRAEAALRQVEGLSAGIALDRGNTLGETGEVGRGLLWLTRSLELAHRAGDGDLEQVARRNLTAWQAHLVRPRATCAHEDWAWAVAFSPDGRTALTGGKDRTARRWDVATGRPLGEPLHHAYPVWDLAYSPDGRWILTGSGDEGRNAGEARIWDAATGRPILPPLPHPGEVTGVSFSPDGRTFLTICSAEARLGRTADGQPAGILLRHPRPMRSDRRLEPKMSAAFSPDGRLIATGGRMGRLGSGMPRQEDPGASRSSPRGRSWRWPSAPMAGPSRPAASTAAPGCGTSLPAGVGAPTCLAPAASRPSRSAPTGRSWPRPERSKASTRRPATGAAAAARSGSGR